MSWSPPSVPNSDFDRNGMMFDSGSHMYSPQLKERQLQHPSPVNYSPDLPRVIDDAEFCSLPNRTPVSCSICGKVYRHKISYLKHQWEHHELWDTCLRFNVSKHQQVQMMEAKIYPLNETNQTLGCSDFS
ncbi:hypothetical protein DSO57_1016874 [Entomophthora muscae]|uniref:Uncharacterized protein n=1 Tax=Entomophthora muscae TaxID=34485 RepID=A0ACC2TSB6_9FUNG|nr:hypothetical protein DSO57_1016874 [Entomophthora muscae]